MSQNVILTGTVVGNKIALSGSIPSAADIAKAIQQTTPQPQPVDLSKIVTKTDLAAAVADIEAKIAALGPVTPPTPGPTPPPGPAPGTTTYGVGYPGYDASIPVPSQSLNGFIASLLPPPVDGGTITLPAGVFSPGSLIENAALNNTASTLRLVGAGNTKTGTVFDGRGGQGAGFNLEWRESSVLVRCRKASIQNIMFYRAGGADNNGDAEAGVRAYAGYVQYVEVGNCLFVLCENGVFMPNGDFVTVAVPYLDGPWVFVHDSTFLSDGETTGGSQAHCMYTNGVRTDTLNLTMTNNGHGYGIKSRSADGTHINNSIVSTIDGAGYDFPQGGDHTIWGGTISSPASAGSKWLIRVGEEAQYGLKKPAGQNIIRVGGGCIIDNQRAVNALQAEAGCKILFDTSVVFTGPRNHIELVTEDLTGVMLYDQPLFTKPAMPSPPA